MKIIFMCSIMVLVSALALAADSERGPLPGVDDPRGGEYEEVGVAWRKHDERVRHGVAFDKKGIEAQEEDNSLEVAAKELGNEVEEEDKYGGATRRDEQVRRAMARRKARRPPYHPSPLVPSKEAIQEQEERAKDKRQLAPFLDRVHSPAYYAYRKAQAKRDHYRRKGINASKGHPPHQYRLTSSGEVQRIAYKKHRRAPKRKWYSKDHRSKKHSLSKVVRNFHTGIPSGRVRLKTRDFSTGLKGPSVRELHAVVASNNHQWKLLHPLRRKLAPLQHPLRLGGRHHHTRDAVGFPHHVKEHDDPWLRYHRQSTGDRYGDDKYRAGTKYLRAADKAEDARDWSHMSHREQSSRARIALRDLHAASNHYSEASHRYMRKKLRHLEKRRKEDALVTKEKRVWLKLDLQKSRFQERQQKHLARSVMRDAAKQKEKVLRKSEVKYKHRAKKDAAMEMLDLKQKQNEAYRKAKRRAAKESKLSKERGVKENKAKAVVTHRSKLVTRERHEKQSQKERHVKRVAAGKCSYITARGNQGLCPEGYQRVLTQHECFGVAARHVSQGRIGNRACSHVNSRGCFATKEHSDAAHGRSILYFDEQCGPDIHTQADSTTYRPVCRKCYKKQVAPAYLDSWCNGISKGDADDLHCKKAHKIYLEHKVKDTMQSKKEPDEVKVHAAKMISADDARAPKKKTKMKKTQQQKKPPPPGQVLSAKQKAAVAKVVSTISAVNKAAAALAKAEKAAAASKN